MRLIDTDPIRRMSFLSRALGETFVGCVWMTFEDGDKGPIYVLSEETQLDGLERLDIQQRTVRGMAGPYVSLDRRL